MTFKVNFNSLPTKSINNTCQIQVLVTAGPVERYSTLNKALIHVDFKSRA